MNPQKQSDDRSISVPQRHTSSNPQSVERDAAAKIMREQIDKLYDSHSAGSHTASNDSATSPYEKSHTEAADHAAANAHSEQWKQYHTQWQNYYQQYYERYYMSQLATKQKKVEGHAADSAAVSSPAMITAGEPEPLTLSKSDAVSELRNQLLDKVKAQSSRVRRSKHFVPVAAAFIVAFSFIFLQYNSVIFGTVKAYVSPGSINPSNLIVDPTTDTKVGPEPRIVIPKINVDAPVVYDVPSIQESVVQEKLKSGVVHYPIPGASALPGQKGNSVILGHSSNDVFDDGGYKFVFVQLNNLEKGDTFYLNYNGTRYTYSIIEKKIIDPTQVSELVINNGKPLATLVTCDPPGTALKRLVVIAEQISPDPDQASESEQTTTDVGKATIPGNTPTLFERLFGQ